MALVTNRLGDTLVQKARSKLGTRFGRFTAAAIAAFATTEVVLTICAGPLDLTATWASIVAWFSGALVSYVLSRWAWKGKGRPSLLNEPLPFWVVSAMVVVILLLATKFAYHSAGWMNLTGVERVLYVDAVYGMANIGTFLLRFLFFHYVLFAASVVQDPPGAAEEALASTAPRAPPAGSRAPAPRKRPGRCARCGTMKTPPTSTYPPIAAPR